MGPAAGDLVELTPSCAIAVMAKASAPGRTKTRLVPPLSYDEAAAFNTAFLQDIAASLLRAGERTSIAAYMAYGPGGPDFFRRHLPPEIGLLEACYPNFGDCLFATIDGLLTRGHRAAVVLNSDSPTLPTALLVETAERLAAPGERAVLGPANDGGYYLLGLQSAHRRLFDDIAWSTEHVTRQTLERAAEIGLPVEILPTWYDVDDVDALRTLHAELFGGFSFGRNLVSNRAHNTQRLMDCLSRTSGLAARIGVTHLKDVGT